MSITQYPDNQPDRIDLFDGQITHQASQELWDTGDHPDHGLQTAGVSTERLEAAQGICTADIGGKQREVPGRSTGRGSVRQERRLTSYTTFDNNSP
jgi:hypothetical protein